MKYNQQVATSSGLGVFWKLLFKWRGSVYKLVWQNLTLYILLYYSLSFSYRFGLNQDGRVMLGTQYSYISYLLCAGQV